MSADGLEPPSARKLQINNYPLPTDAHSLRQFLGLVNFYRRLIPNFATLAYPLTELIRHNQKSKSLVWSDEALSPFSEIKSAIANAAALPFLSPSSNTFHLVTDSSQFACGASLSQIIEGVPTPVDFFSKKYTETQARYSTFDRELLAAYLAVLHFRDFIEGREVILFTDQKALVNALRSRLPTN